MANLLFHQNGVQIFTKGLRMIEPTGKTNIPLVIQIRSQNTLRNPHDLIQAASKHMTEAKKNQQSCHLGFGTATAKAFNQFVGVLIEQDWEVKPGKQHREIILTPPANTIRLS